MGGIKQLPDAVHSSLRSSVVLFDLTRVVEELVFNSLDAGARKVSVYVGIGTCYVRVEDDGSGISREGLVLLGDRHATSKVNVLNSDEMPMKCFGFRGESLASISDASLLEIVTKVQGSPNGFRKVMKGCKCMFIGIDDDRQAVGTTVVVRDLFYNQPVRRKQMQSSLKKALHSIKKCVLRIALMHWTISFEVVDIESEEELVLTNASVSPLSIMRNCFGIDICRNMHELNFSDDELKISGHVAYPDVNSSSTKDFQFIYINSRFICKCRIHKLLDQMLDEFNYSEKSKSNACFPVPKIRSQSSLGYILNINCPYSWYDLILEPSKASVEFKNWGLILNFIENAINKFLSENKRHDDYHNVEMNASKRDVIQNGKDKVALTDCGMENDELTKWWFKCHIPSTRTGIPNHEANSPTDERGDMLCRSYCTNAHKNTDTGDIQLLYPTQDCFEFSYVRPENFVPTSSKRNYSQFPATGINYFPEEDIFVKKGYIKSQHDDYVDLYSDTGHDYCESDDCALVGSFLDSTGKNNDYLKTNCLLNCTSKAEATFKRSFSLIDEGFDDEIDNFNDKFKRTDLHDFVDEHQRTDGDDFKMTLRHTDRDDGLKPKRKRTYLDESRAMSKRVSIDDISGLEEYDNSDNIFSFSSRSMLNKNSNDRLASFIFAESDITNLSSFSRDSSPSLQFNGDRFTSDSYLSNNSVELIENLDIAQRPLLKVSFLPSEPVLSGLSIGDDDFMFEKHVPIYTSDTGSRYLMENKHDNSSLDNDFWLRSCSQGNCNPAYPDSGAEFDFFEDHSCLYKKDRSVYHTPQHHHNVDMSFDEIGGSVSQRSNGVHDKIDSAESSLNISSSIPFQRDEDWSSQLKHQHHGQSDVPGGKPRRSLSAPPYYRGKTKHPLLGGRKQCIGTTVNFNTEQHDGGVESTSNGVVVNNLEKKEMMLSGHSPPHCPIAKLNSSDESISPMRKTCSILWDSANTGKDEPQDFGVKWGHGISKTLNNVKSLHEFDNCDIPDISSGNMHVIGDSLIPKAINRRKSLEVAKVLPQVDKKFIPVVSGVTLIMIDQHAADERIRVEELRQKVLSGEMRTISYLDEERELVLPGIGYQMLQNYAEKIKFWGWIFNIFTDKSTSFTRNLNILHEQPTEIKLVAVPCILGVTLSEADLLEFLQQLVDTDGSSTIPPAVIRILNSKACRGAIMFGDSLLLSECSLIVEELRQTSLWFQCAHGRPTAVPLVNLTALEDFGEEERQSWHGLRKHPPSLSRALQRLEAAAAAYS